MMKRWVTTAIAITLVALSVPIILAFVPHDLDLWGRWCDAGITRSICYRDWLGSYSGWAAALGALLAALLTLPHLTAQAREAKRQTDYLIGDSGPEFILLRNRTKRRVLLEVNNFNRRGIMIENISATDLGLKIHNVVPWDDELAPGWTILQKHRVPPSFRISGWLDRSKQPPQRDFFVIWSEHGTPIRNIAADNRRLTVSIRYRIIGQEQERRTATATAIERDEETGR